MNMKLSVKIPIERKKNVEVNMRLMGNLQNK